MTLPSFHTSCVPRPALGSYQLSLAHTADHVFPSISIGSGQSGYSDFSFGSRLGPLLIIELVHSVIHVNDLL